MSTFFTSKPCRSPAGAKAKLTFAVWAWLLGAIGLMSATSPASAACNTNAITAENCLPGNPASEWDIFGAGDESIQGFATQISVNRGSTISFKVDTTASSYRFDIYRLGYYGGLGARKIATVLPSAALPQNQPQCLSDPTTGLVDCGNWLVSGSWAVPANATSGIYIAKLVRPDNGHSSHIVFIVRNDQSTSDLVFKTSDTTWQAYNDYGGNSLYVGAPAGRAYKVSYNRPFVTRGNQYGRSSLFGAEYPMVRWLEANGYDVTYLTSLDADRSGALLLNHKTFLSIGHDEYWSAGERANVEAARDAGVHLAFFSGNEIFWKTRWENSIDGSATPYRTLVTYKETHANAKIDPTAAWTGTWRDPRFSPPGDGGKPENALSGTIFTVNCCDPSSPAIRVPAAEGKLRFWRNTSVANLAAGQVATLAAGTLGYEWDEDLDNGFRPAGQFRMSLTTVEGVSYLQDYGSTYSSGTATHSLTLHRHSSGALVFGAGTIRWSWGLDAEHDFDSATPNASTTPDVRMQQATVNLLADMGAQPGGLQSGLVSASQSTDAIRPTSAIVSPAAGATVQSGTTVTITGTAVDTGGQVGGVEVSVDNGATWHLANGRASWTYSWIPGALGTATIKSRAVDDSGNIENPVFSRTVTIAAQTCPCSIWDSAATPAVPADTDSGSVELGVKFRANTNGLITGIRFYKGPGNSGTHTGSLWSSTGQLLATAAFTNETATGWQQVNFATPVSITANTVYVASYFAPNGHYSYNSGFFANSGVDRGVLYLLEDGESGGNGVFAYGSSSTFPTSSHNSNYYWVDVVFGTGGGSQDTTAPTIAITTPTAAANYNSGSSPISLGGVASDNVGVTQVTWVNNQGGSGTATGTTAWSVTGVVLQAGVSNVITVTARDAAGNTGTDVLTATLTDTTAPTVASRAPAAGATGVSVVGAVTATFNEAMDATTLNTGTFELRNAANVLIPATVTYNASNLTVTLTPNSVLSAATTYTATLRGGATDPRAKDAAGNALAANVSWSFTTGAATISVWNASATPAVPADTDSSAVELGVKFRSDVNGFITGVRFYKGTGNTGTHTGSLWTSAGALLATATFSNETATGWQEVSFSAPVAITANTVYVASYFAPNGHYSYNSAFFANSGVDQGVLHLLQNGVSGGNGVYGYSASGAFPNSTYNSNNYWVDVVFSPVVTDTAAPTTPAGLATSVVSSTQINLSWTASTDNVGVTGYQIERCQSAGCANFALLTTVTGTTYNNTGLTASTSYSYRVRATDAAGNLSAYSNTATAVTQAAPDTTAPTAPTNLSATATSNTQTSLSWTASTDNVGVTGYRVERCLGSTCTSFAQIGTPTATTYGDSGLAASTVYRYRVRAVDAAGNLGAYSNIVAVTTLAAPDTTAPTAPTNLTAVAASSTQTTLNWTASTDNVGVTGYRVERCQGSTCTGFAQIGTPTATTYGDSGLTANTVYRYRVRAVDAAGNLGAYSSIATVTTLTVDTTAPVITITAPTANATYSTGSSPINLGGSASDNVGVTQVTWVNNQGGSGTATGTTAWSVTGIVLQPGVNNVITVTARDAAGNTSTDTLTATLADTTAPTIVSRVPATGATGISTSAAVTVTFSEPMDATTLSTSTFELRNASNVLVPATVSYNASTLTATLTPGSALANSTTYTATLKGGATDPRVKDAAGNALAANATWSFTTAAAAISVWNASATPAVPADTDASAVELGVKFRSDVNGFITGVRFYKGAGNTGTHTGSVWSGTGTLLATATFTNETATGWQQVNFATPLAITANTVYVVSYFAPNGHYAYNSTFFANSGVDQGVLHLLQNGASGGNGVYAYGASSSFPNATYNSNNYWVDVVFSQ